MKMLDVVLPDSHETVDLCDGNADQGLFLVFSKNGDFIGVISGSIAYAYWKEMNEDMKDYALEILPKEMIKVINDFDNFIKQQ